METILNKEIIFNRTLTRFLGVLIFVICTSLGAFVRIPLPFSPVPLTLQTFFVLLSGAFLGSGLGAVTQASYILLGFLGVPIFSGAGGGWLYFFGPTAGYLVGFILAALFIGKFTQPLRAGAGFIKYARNSLFYTFVVFCLGDLILLASGVIWLKVIFGYSLGKLLFIGFLPFVAGDLVKAFCASVIYLKLKPRLKEIP
jgi:biotin transport system substrate-specific component